MGGDLRPPSGGRGRGSWNEPLKVLEVREGVEPFLDSASCSSHPTLVEAPLWGRIFHLKCEQRSREAKVSLAGEGSCSTFNAGWLCDLEQDT